MVVVVGASGASRRERGVVGEIRHAAGDGRRGGGVGGFTLKRLSLKAPLRAGATPGGGRRGQGAARSLVCCRAAGLCSHLISHSHSLMRHASRRAARPSPGLGSGQEAKAMRNHCMFCLMPTIRCAIV